MLAFANPSSVPHRLIPLYCATRFVTIIVHYAHGLEDRCVGNQAALLLKISVRVKHATQG
jgi:hypothetical protein